MDNVETGDEDVRKNLGAIPSAKAVNPQQQQQQQQYGSENLATCIFVVYRTQTSFEGILSDVIASSMHTKIHSNYPPI